MEYKKLKSQKLLNAFSRLYAVLDCYGHTEPCFVVSIAKEKYLSGAESMADIRRNEKFIVSVVLALSELSRSARDCALRGCFNVARDYVEHIRIVSILL